ncbi:M16 family metallopeptidase [Flocculibacter collagenilyticus]|uniref:M16 family metallopeptidase n=1 Tax=Flocculibacter collagenilyticus TaxID=2744479 RepID=UPI0018F5544D|nr:pitrilysin family protein [Flocculibacter collagenilyticus]
MKKTYKRALTLVSVTLSAIVTTTVNAAYSLPEYTKTELNNGLTVYLLEQHEVPLIDVNVVVKAGAVEDGKLAGLSYLTAENLKLGTKSLTKDKMDETLDFIGAEVVADSSLEFSQISASLAKKDLNKVLPILKDMVAEPAFDKAEFEKHKSRYLLQLQQLKESPKSVINNYFNKTLFGGSGYGSVEQGDTESVTAITIDDIKQYHQTWYQPSQSAIIVVGDFETQAMLKQVKALFGEWENTKTPKRTEITGVKDFKNANVVLVNKADAIESTFMIGGKGVARSNPDYIGIRVINTILGGRFTSWLNDELRVNSGLTYGARSAFRSYSQAGTFAISTFTKSSTTEEAMDLALQTYQRLWNKGIDEKTLASAKAYVKGQFPTRYETSTQLADLLANMFGYGFDEQFINTFEQQVNSLTTAKAKTLINKYFPKDNLQFVVVGKAEEIAETLTKYGKVKQLEIKDAGYDVKL